MLSTLLVIFLAAFAVVWARWLRVNRRARERWLARVNLPGIWEWRRDGAASALEFAGGPAEGTYVERSSAMDEKGHWSLHGSRIRFTPAQGRPADCELRLFEDGSIGIDGPGRERRIYVRRASNVVPLRSRR